MSCSTASQQISCPHTSSTSTICSPSISTRESFCSVAPQEASRTVRQMRETEAQAGEGVEGSEPTLGLSCPVQSAGT